MEASIARSRRGRSSRAQVKPTAAQHDERRPVRTDILLDAAVRLGIKNLTISTEREKTLITGDARYLLDCDFFFDAVKQMDGWESDIVVDLTVERRDIRGYHTVQEGETLADIAKRHLGSAEREWEIVEANRDRMNAPDQISPGQQLLIPRR